MIIADPVNRKPLKVSPDRKKEYLKQYGGKVEIVVMDMSHSFKAALERVRRLVQKSFSDYGRKKCKRMKQVFYKRKEKQTDKQRWYLEC